MKSSHYIEIQPERDVSGDNFSKGMINFNWTMDSTGYFNPYKSFMKIRFTLYDATGAARLAQGDDIAPNMFLPAQLFQQLKMNINNVCVSEIGDYVPQVNALRERMYSSEDRHKNYLRDLTFSDAYYRERLSMLLGNVTEAVAGTEVVPCNDIRRTRNKAEYEAIWHLPLAFFSVDEFIPGCQGLFNLQLTPQPGDLYRQMAIEAIGANKVHGAAGDFTFNVITMQLYMLKGVGPPVSSSNIKLQLREIRCQSQNLTTAALHQKTFQVHPRASELTVAYQDPRVLSDNRYSAAKFRSNLNEELNLTRFWIDFGGKQLPTPIADIDNSANRDFWTQRYVETLMYTNALYSPEPYDKWFERGVYLHFAGYGEDEKDDRVFISQQFSALGANRPNVLLFDHFTKNVIISIEGSRLSNVSSD